MIDQHQQFATDLQSLRDGIAALNRQANAGNASEMDTDNFTPEAFGQLLMNHLDDCETFTTSNKVFWVQVAHHMGPDWLGALRKAVAFAIKSDEF